MGESGCVMTWNNNGVKWPFSVKEEREGISVGSNFSLSLVDIPNLT